MSLPQWAMATTAALVLAISVPVLMLRNSAQSNQATPNQEVPASVSANRPQDANPEVTIQSKAAAAVDAASKQPTPDSSTSAITPPRKREAETEAKGPAGAAGASNIVGGVVVQPQKPDSKNASVAADEAQRKSPSELAEQAPAQSGAASSQGAKKVDSDDSREQRLEKDSAAKQAPESKPGRVDEPRDKEKTAKAEEVAPPPPAPAASSEVAKARGGLKRSPKLALRDSGGAGESVRASKKTINRKDFFFRDNTWTDKDFDPNKDLPVVTIIRDSNVYKELLAKRAGLKPYLDGFSETERAIIVYKGTVYKLIPQK